MTAPFYLEEIAVLAALAGVLAVDDRAGWQALVAHPVVSSAAVGLIFGDFVTAISVGVVLELVWFSVLPMRGKRRPDAVAGSIVGAGSACLLVTHTGDPRRLFVITVATVLGLITGELAGSIGRRIHREREKRLGGFEPAGDGRALQRRLVRHLMYSVCFIAGAEALVVAVMLPISALLAGWFTGAMGTLVSTGARWWLDVIPVLGAGALIHMYWHKQQNRYLVLSGAVVLVLLWIR